MNEAIYLCSGTIVFLISVFFIYIKQKNITQPSLLLQTNGIFKHNKADGITCILSGVFVFGLFVFIGFIDRDASLDCLLVGLTLGVFFVLIGIGFLLFNFKAFFYIENGRIKGKYHYFGRIDCNIDDVAFALGRNKTLIIQLKDGRTHTITGIENAWQLASTIRYNMPFDVNEQSDVLIKKLAYLKSSKKNGLIYVLSGSALMFVIIFIMIFLIGERELYEFVKNDWMITAILGLAWIAAFVTTFHFFKIIEKNNISIERLKYHIQRTVVEAHPLLPGNVIKVLSDENYVGRITVFGYPNDNSVYYTVEQFTSDYTLFKSYESEIFDNVEQLRELLEAMIDITEKVLH